MTALFEFYKYTLSCCSFSFVTRKNFLAGKISSNAQSQLANSDHKTAIQTLLSKIETDFEHIPSLEEAATQTGISKFYFARHFRNCTDIPTDYIKPNSFKEGLVETNDAICKLLCLRFSRCFSFNRSFKRNWLHTECVSKAIFIKLTTNLPLLASNHSSFMINLSLHQALRPLQNIFAKMDIQLRLEQKQQLLQLHGSRLV